MGGRRDRALVAAGVAGRIRIIVVDVRRFVLDAFFPVRAVIVGAFVPMARAVLAPVAVAVLMRGRRDRALVAADVAGSVRVIGVDVRLFVLDAFGLFRAVRVGTFVPVVRTVLAPIAVAVFVRWRRHGECRGLGVYGRRAHAVAARIVVRVPEHTAEQLTALCRRDGRDRVAGNVVPSVAQVVLYMTDAAGAFDVHPVLAAVGAALPLILQCVEILIDQLGGECHRITHSRGHAPRLLRDHRCDAHKEPPETDHGFDRIVGIGQRDMDTNVLIVHFIRDGDGIGFARGWDRSPLLFRWCFVSADIPAVFRCDTRQRAYGVPGFVIVKTGGNGRGLALNEFAVSPHGRGRAAQNCGTVVRGKRMGICRAILIRRRTAEFCAVQGERQKRLIGGFGRAIDILPSFAAVLADLPLQRRRRRADNTNGQGHVFTALDHTADILHRAGELRHIADGHAAVRLGIVLIPADGHSLHLCILGDPEVELSAAVGSDMAVVECRTFRKPGKGDVLHGGILFRKGQSDLF